MKGDFMKHLIAKRIDLDEAKGDDKHRCGIRYNPKEFPNASKVLMAEGFQKNEDYEKDKKKKSGDDEYFIITEKDEMAFNLHFNNIGSKGIRELAKAGLVIKAQGEWRKSMKAKAGILSKKQLTKRESDVAEMLGKLKEQCPDMPEEKRQELAESLV